MPTRFERANAIRALAMDAVQQAKSGHPGMPMGMADIAEVLWVDFLNHAPTDPHWPNRDRFVLSNGHGSMLLYSLLYLSGYDLSLDELKAFRQLHSKTPGHPEYGITPGVETTTGPLGQGLANAVGMALAERHMAETFNTADFQLFSHYTYAFVGDGCLMEGISHEACSFAGTLGLHKLIVFWDDNGISIDGKVDTWFNENTALRFKAYNWHVIGPIDGHNPDDIAHAITEAKAQNKPSFIICKTQIGFGSPNLANSEKSHGAPLGDEEIAASKKALAWPHGPFEIPDIILQSWRQLQVAGNQKLASWNNLLENYKNKYPDKYQALMRRLHKQAPSAFMAESDAMIEATQVKANKVASRKASQHAINAYAPYFPELIGGSADLTGSNNTNWNESKTIKKSTFAGNYLHFGVREFAMSAMANGMAVYGGIIPFVGTFLVFSDYAKNAVRLSALMRQQVIYIFTHDSIGLGEDGPTHQPIEQLAMLRLTPHTDVWRPADETETFVAWQQALLATENPSCLALSRQGLPPLPRSQTQLKNIQKGGYVLYEPKNNLQAIIIATGSEVTRALDAAWLNEKAGIATRVVSMPCTRRFDAQTDAYKASVLPPQIKNRVAVEAAASDFWYKYVGLAGKVVGLNTFGESAPIDDVYNALGITTENIAKAVAQTLNNTKSEFMS